VCTKLIFFFILFVNIVLRMKEDVLDSCGGKYDKSNSTVSPDVLYGLPTLQKLVTEFSMS